MATKSATKSATTGSKKSGCNCGCGTLKKQRSTVSRQVESGTEMCSSNKTTRTRSKATTNTKSVSNSRKTR